MFDVQSKTWPVAVSWTSMVTVKVPSVKVPSATGSTLNVVVPTGHEAFPGTVVGLTCSADAGSTVNSPTTPAMAVQADHKASPDGNAVALRPPLR